jgi:hypothetical protein
MLAAPAAASALGTTLKITSPIFVTEKVGSDGQFVKRGQVIPGSVFVHIGVSADGDCQTWFIKNGPNTTGPFPGRAVPTKSGKRWAVFELKVPLNPPNRQTSDFRAGNVALTPDGRHLLVMAPDSSAISVFERRLKPERPTPARSSIRLVKGRLTVRATCPATAQSACYGSGEAVAGGHLHGARAVPREGRCGHEDRRAAPLSAGAGATGQAE